MTHFEIDSITVQLNRKKIKNLYINVLPPLGSVRVSAPEKMTDTAIRLAILNRMEWIKKQQRYFAQQPRQSDRKMVSGESHYLWGKRYRLNVVNRKGKHEIILGHDHLHLYVNHETNIERKTLVLNLFYRDVLKEQITKLLPFWENKINQAVSSWGIKQMKTRWGTCNTQARRIWLNLELAKKPPECLEYILVHELVHLIERNHGARFKALMDKFLPDWRERKTLLNQLPLSHL